MSMPSGEETAPEVEPDSRLRRKVGISCSFTLQPARDAPELLSCRYLVNCARPLWESHDGDSSQLNSGMVSWAWILPEFRCAE